MRLSLFLNIVCMIILFGSLESRWSRTLPRSETKKILKIFKSQTMVKSRSIQSLPKRFRKKSSNKIMNKYCRFLLGAYEECLEKYLGFNLRNVQQNEEKQKRRQNTTTTVLLTSTTSSPPVTKNEKIYVRIY